MDKKYFIKDRLKYNGFPFSIRKMTLISDCPLHSHDYDELEIIIDGTARNIVGGENYEMRAGDVFVVGGDTTHEICNVDNLVLFNIEYSAAELEALGGDLRQIPGYQALFVLEKLYIGANRYKSRMRLSGSAFDAAFGILSEMEEEYRKGSNGFKAMLRSGFIKLIVLLSRNYQQNADINQSSISEVARAAAYMEREYTGEINIGDIASSAHMSERHFRRIFKEVHGIPPNEYILEKRISHSKRLLKNTDVSVIGVANDSGFTDSNYFSRIFKCRTGMTPSEYRSDCRNRIKKGTV